MIRILYALGVKNSQPKTIFPVWRSADVNCVTVPPAATLNRSLIATPVNSDTTPTVKTWLGILSPVGVFLVLCCAILPYAGLQADETLFTSPLYTRVAKEFRIRPVHFDIPLMLLSYLGTAKTWLYGLLFQFWRPSILSVRLPVVLVGALTLVIWSLLAFRIARPPVARILCLLLATDASFLLTTTFDWGPVAHPAPYIRRRAAVRAERIPAPEPAPIWHRRSSSSDSACGTRPCSSGS